MLTITDSFVLLGEGSIQDREVSEAYQKLIRKVGETNQFLALEAKQALKTLCESTEYGKSLSFLYPHYEDKPPVTRIMVSACILTIMENIGSPNINYMPE